MRRPHSYSSVSAFKKCPKFFEWVYVLGNRSPPNKAAERGTELHARLEEFFKGAPYPVGVKALAPWRRYMENLSLHTPIPERDIATDREWVLTGYEDGNAYARGKIDLEHGDDHEWLHLLDWKSGRVYPNHEEQGEFYVAMSPEYDVIYTHFVYLDDPLSVVTRIYTCTEQKVIRKKLNTLIDSINDSTEYPATPSRDACKYCPRSWRNGGDCRAAP